MAEISLIMLEYLGMRSLNVFVLSMINVAAICSIKNFPYTAEYGFASVFYFAVAALFFFIPVSLVSAELATGWSERGGIFVWVKEAMGHRLGFLAIWLQWIENVVYFPTVLTFIAATIAYATIPSLALNPLYTFGMVLSLFWLITWITLKGTKVSGIFSALTVILGTIIPGLLIIGLGFAWYYSGKPTDIFSTHFIPDLSSPDKMSLMTGVLLGLAGMEMSASHAREVQNPQKNFPRAIFLSAIIIMILSVLGALSIAIVIPQGKIILHAGTIESITLFLQAYHLEAFAPVMAFLIAFGAIGTLSTWAAGPPKGLLAAAQCGDLPPILHTLNKRDMPLGMLIFQGIIVTLLSTLFFFSSSVSNAFWMLIVLAAQLYLLMYSMMFVSALILRYKHPDVYRAYKIPGGHFGIWLVCLTGLFGCLFSFFLGFIPPAQLGSLNKLFYVGFLITGVITLSMIPFIILLFKRPSWDRV